MSGSSPRTAIHVMPFDRTPREAVAALGAEERALGPRIAELMAEWEALEEEPAADAG